jgi:hypothetical protein
LISLVVRGALFLFASLGVLATAAIVALIVGGFLVLFQSPEFEGCRLAPGEPPTTELPSRSLVEIFETRWAELQAALLGGSTATVSYSNAEATARARSYLDEHTDRIDNLVLCFEPGKAKARGDIRAFLGRKVGVVAEGRMDFSGDYPEVRLSRVKTGALPFPVPMRRLVEREVNRELRDLVLRHDFSATFDYNKVTVTARP